MFSIFFLFTQPVSTATQPFSGRMAHLAAYYSVSQKPRNPKFKGKYFASMVEKSLFAVISGNTGLLSPWVICDLTQFLLIHCPLVNCFCNNYHAAFKSATHVHC
jgi:hypothetical protein